MPNPKLGTVTMAVKEAVAAARRGQAEFKVEKRGILMTGFGKVSFTHAELRDNARALLLAINDLKPEGVKGSFMRWAVVRSTMGPAVPLDMAVIDPTNPRFMESMPQATGADAAAGVPLHRVLGTQASAAVEAVPAPSTGAAGGGGAELR